MYDSEFYYKLDNNPYKITFQDGIYDLRDYKFNKGYSDYDYITKTIPFDYQTPNEEHTDFVKNVHNSSPLAPTIDFFCGF